MNGRELAVQRCRGCGRVLYPHRRACPNCGSVAPEADGAAGPGTVVDVVTLHLVPGRGKDATSNHPLFVLVLLDSGPRVLARADSALVRGDGVRLVVEESGAVVAVHDGKRRAGDGSPFVRFQA